MITALAMSRFLGITLVIGVVGRPKKMTAGTQGDARARVCVCVCARVCVRARAYNGVCGRERESGESVRVPLNL